MIDFRGMAPMDPQRRKEQAPRVTRLLNGAKFEFIDFCTFVGGGAPDRSYIRGRYLDYAGEWVYCAFDEKGRVHDRKFSEMDLDWSSARE